MHRLRSPLALLICAACASSSPADTATSEARPTIRGQRICELNQLAVEDGYLVMNVYNDMGMHDCPDAWLEQIDPTQYAIGGPRWRSADYATTLGDAPELVPVETPPGLGYDMALAASVALVEVSMLEEQLGTTITTIDDVPSAARTMLLEATLRSTDFRVAEVQREFLSEFTHYAGQDVFVLDDGSCEYAMKYYTSVFDAELVDEDAVATLGDRFTQLPEGFSFSVQVFDDDLIISEDQGIQYVMTDEFGNSYDRFRCD